MSDVGLIAIMLAAFLLAIGLVRLLGRLIASGAQGRGWADAPDTGQAALADPADGPAAERIIGQAPAAGGRRGRAGQSARPRRLC
jgi:hypothetical protein